MSAPGADDDGSGTTVLLETLTLLVAEGFRSTAHELQFHFYSAEEGGLLGSQAVAKAYAAEVQRRMRIESDACRALVFGRCSSRTWSVSRSRRSLTRQAAYVKSGVPERIGVIEDFVDPKLTDLVEKLVNEYSGLKAIRTKCGCEPASRLHIADTRRRLL